MDEIDRERRFANTRRTRRNIVAGGMVAGAALLARMRLAKASPVAITGGGGGGQCFLKGTKIQTAVGEQKVEDLAIGDLLPTVFGGLRPILWIGRYRFRKSDPHKPWVKDALPVRVARSALAPNVPRSDLYLTKAHALFIDGILVTVGSLINGSTIAVYPAEEYEELEFFHLKLETHDVIYAEGAPSETLLMVDENANNFADYYRRYGTPQSEGQRCAPILSIDGGRAQIKSRFRSAISPWLDRRHPVDVIRDRLEDRAVDLTPRLRTVS